MPVPSLLELAIAFGEKLRAESPAAVPASSQLMDSTKALQVMLGQMGTTLADLVDGRPVADLGSGDPEFSLFLQSLGCGVEAIQQGERSNWDDWAPGDQPFGLALVLGLLNEVPSPMRLLRNAAASADYCFAKVRVARHAPDGAPITHLPVGYLLDLGETPGDIGHWIYSETGLRRLVERSGWEACAWINAGDQQASEPIGDDHAEHVYCLLRRRDLFTNGRLLEGWYPAEGARDGWRWTRDMATLRFQTARPGTARLRFVVPVERFVATGPFTVSALSAGEVLGTFPVARAGEHVFDVALPGNSAELDLAYWVSPVAGAQGDERVLGVIAKQVLFYPAK